MRRTLWLLATIGACAAWSAPAVGQDGARGGFWLGVGGVRHGETDLLASPLRFRGTAPALALGYRRVGGTRFAVDASFARPRLESALSRSEHTATAYLVTVEARWLWPVAGAERWRLFAGGQLDVHAPIRDHDYFQGQGELYADLFAPVSVAAAHEARLTASLVISQRLAVPVAAVVVRSPYTGIKYFPGVDLAWPGRLVGLEHALVVDHALTASWGARGEWRTTLLRYPVPRELSLVTHRVEVGLELHP